MRIILLCFISSLIATTYAVTIPQITDYSIPSIAYTIIHMLASWSDLKNVGTFNAKDVAVGLDGVYAIDTSYKVWNYSVLTGAKKATWNDHSLVAAKISPLITGDLAYIDKTDSTVYITLLGVTARIGNTSNCASDLAVSLMATSYIITCTNEIWTYVLTDLVWQVVPITELTAAGTYPVAISVDVDENLWVVDHATNVWSQNTTTGVWTKVSSASTVGATDISVGIDGSVWISRLNPSGKSGLTDTAQYISNSDSFFSFGPTATAVAAFDLIYAGVTDTLSTNKKPNAVQTCDVLGISSILMSKITGLVSSYLP
jgi:hypothetical protein